MHDSHGCETGTFVSLEPSVSYVEMEFNIVSSLNKILGTVYDNVRSYFLERSNVHYAHPGTMVQFNRKPTDHKLYLPLWSSNTAKPGGCW